MHNRATRFFLSTTFLLTAIAGAARSDQPVFITFGALPGIYTTASGVSADGSVVVGYQTAEQPQGGLYTDMFRWTHDGGKVMLGLSSSSTQTGYRRVGAHAVTANGEVLVGGRSLWNVDGDEAFMWTESGGMVGLGISGSSIDVAADGSVIVGTRNIGVSPEAFRWTMAGGTEGLGDLPGNRFHSESRGVSADGAVVVGFSYSDKGGQEAFRWTSTDGMVGLGGLPGATVPVGTEILSAAQNLSADGSVVVGYSRSVLTSEYEAFRWTSAGGMVGLGDLPGGVFRSQAYDVSGDGSVVVGWSRTSLGREPFIWREGDGMRNLRDVLVSEFGLNFPGFTLLSATDISADGRTILGEGTNAQGDSESWLAYLGSPVPFPGDANGDQVVDFTDLGILLNNYDQPGTFATGDFDSTGIVDFTDLGILLNHYNLHAPAISPAAAVPEPSTLALATFGALGLIIALRRKR